MNTAVKYPDRAGNFLSGALAMLPLCISVIPWGILAGSMAVQSGLSFPQSLGMSAILFAGAAQLVTLSMLNSGVSGLVIVLSVFFITAQHFLYGLTLREKVSSYRGPFRFLIGFLLTDELFALSMSRKENDSFSAAFMLGAGLVFYLCWVIFSLTGILLASSVPDLSRFHLDFSIIATFASIVVPMVNRSPVLVGTLSALGLSMIFTVWHIAGAIIFAGVAGMAIALAVESIIGESQ